MSTDFVIKSQGNPRMFYDTAYKSGAETYQFDFSPWAEDNNTVSTVTWTVKSGNATVSGAALASNVASALVTYSNNELVLIQILANTGTEIYIAYLTILAEDPQILVNDYGMITGS